MKIPEYPEDFMEFKRDKRIADDELTDIINNEIVEMINKMERMNIDNLSKSFQNVIVYIDRLDYESGNKFEISVCEKHSKALV